MKYKAILYDMDGTVLDTLADLSAAVNHSLSVYSYPAVSAAHVRRSLGNGARRLISCCLPENADEASTNELLEYYKKYYDAHCCIETAPYEGIVQLMEKLRDAGVKQAILSNKPHSAVQPLAEKFFSGLLEFALGESETVRKKPDPSGLLSAAARLGFALDECLYVGDSEVDVQTARNAGMDCVAVSWGFRDRDELVAAGAQMIADSVKELEDIIKGVT